MASRKPRQQLPHEVIDFGRTGAVILDVAAGRVDDVLLTLEHHRVEAQLMQAPLECAARGGQVIDEVLERGRLVRDFRMRAPDVADVDGLEPDDDVGGGRVLLSHLAASMRVRLEADRRQRVAGAPADRLTLDHVGPGRRHAHGGCDLGHHRPAHHGAGRVAGADEHDVKHGQYLARVDLAALTDRIEIDDLGTRYATAVDSKDWDLYRTCFTADAVIDYTAAGGVRAGVEEMTAWLDQALGGFTHTVHYVTNRAVTLDGDRATGRLGYYNPMGLADNKLFIVAGYYNDVYVRTDAGWRIAERVEEVVWMKTQH